MRALRSSEARSRQLRLEQHASRASFLDELFHVGEQRAPHRFRVPGDLGKLYIVDRFTHRERDAVPREPRGARWRSAPVLLDPIE